MRISKFEFEEFSFNGYGSTTTLYGDTTQNDVYVIRESDWTVPGFPTPGWHTWGPYPKGDIPNGFRTMYGDWIASPEVSGRNSCSLIYYESKDSISDASWNSLDKKEWIRYIPKFVKHPGIYLRQPIKPVWTPPNFILPPIPKPPEKYVLPSGIKRTSRSARFEEEVNNRRKAKYLKRLAKWDTLALRQKAAYAQRRLVYDKLYAKYVRNLTVYERRLAKSKSWSKPKRVRHIVRRPLEDHDYFRIALRRLDESNSMPICRSVDTAYILFPHTVNLNSTPILFTDIESDLPGAADKIADDIFGQFVRQTVSLRDELDAKLISKFYSKLSKQQVHYANIIAERAQTINLFRSSVKALSELVTLKRNLFHSLGRFATSPKLIGDNYLAFQFGIKPLLDDIYGTLVNIYEFDTIIDEIAIRTNSKVDVFIDTPAFKASGKLERSLVHKFKIPNPLAHTLQNYGLINPAEVAWEVLPFSFVVDWFLPVSSFISALTSEVGLEHRTGVFSEKFLGTIELNPTLLEPPFGDSEFLTQGGEFALKYHWRSLESLPDKFKVLHIKSPLSVTHGLESLALIAQRAFRSR